MNVTQLESVVFGGKVNGLYVYNVRFNQKAKALIAGTDMLIYVTNKTLPTLLKAINVPFAVSYKGLNVKSWCQSNDIGFASETNEQSSAVKSA